MGFAKSRIALGSIAGVTLLTVCVSCAPQQASPGQTDEGETTAGLSAAASTVSIIESDPYNPIVKEREDGTLVQRTPTEGEVTTALDSSYTYHLPENNVPYNTYYLKADEKGCNACHDDLAETLAAMTYPHVDLRNPFGIQTTVQMCKDCHTYGYGYLTNQESFGSLIHGIHNTSEKAECWNCHVGTGSGDGMQLWDEAKHDQLRGITPIANVTGEFSYDQDKLIPASDLFDFGWNYFDLDYLRTENTADDKPLDQEMFDNWTITISGAVDHEITYTLPQLIETFESVEVPFTLHCTLNPTGGPLLGNCLYTAIPLSALFEEAGISPDAGAFTTMAPDGFTESVQMSNFTEAYLAYEIDGEKLSWKHGYPVQLIVPGSGAPASVKEVSDIVVNTQEEAESLHEWNGWPKKSGDGNTYTPTGWPFTDENGYQNKPNVGLFDFEEGRIVETGVPFEFTGYATAWDENIIAMEFSMDGGATWTRFDTPGVTKDQWVIWHFSYTPETDSAYVLSIRSVAEDGRVTEEPIEVLFNAKSH
ncbi:MAG TPA: molybdopterin-dependent oxidoreductase [Rubneribacter badeniensis]|uniref:Molybdopterin-dependent oxidoreductase n=1 Tax=Rubneribacter badeniensis TaxID=2070688 RepID=A0A9D2VJS1_9ACTN|nr:molybdopterin-dependent oxidoreductase [Rubneribacter badeniensis]